jgi:hypothetical protein
MWNWRRALQAIAHEILPIRGTLMKQSAAESAASQVMAGLSEAEPLRRGSPERNALVSERVRWYTLEHSC